MINRNTTESELIEAISSGEIIKEFPRDKYGPSCLIFGYSKNSRPIHVLVTFSDPSWFINSYEPSIQEWVNFRKRKI